MRTGSSIFRITAKPKLFSHLAAERNGSLSRVSSDRQPFDGKLPPISYGSSENANHVRNRDGTVAVHIPRHDLIFTRRSQPDRNPQSEDGIRCRYFSVSGSVA